MANVLIEIASEFTGNKAFKQADSATEKLSKNVKKLAGAFGLAFGTAQVIAYGKASIKAAAADQKAQQQLALALKNVGLGRDAASSEDFIQKLQSEFGIVDDKLRPAYQTLAVATRDTAESQKLLQLALDISASTGKDLGTVTGALSKAYLGNNTALSKLGVGISKADLKTGKFEDIVKQLQTTFAGSATASANTFQGSIDKLGVAAANASEIIGTGLIDALTNLGENTSVAELATNLQNASIYIADVIRGIGVMTSKLKDIPVLGNFQVGMIPIVGSYLEILRKAGVKTGDVKASDNAHLKSLQTQFDIIKKTAVVKKKLTADELKALNAAKLKAAIDKANLALLKGEEVFDMDKIQIAAALANQAEQLGKATSSAQILQIANDTARLNVKKSILELEDAIASKDEAAIVKATEKLNADLKILGALSGQNVKLQDIKSILDSLKPKDLINLDNLNAALAKIAEMLGMLSKFGVESKAPIPKSSSLGSGIPVGDFIAPISRELGLAASTDALLEYADAATERANAFAMLQEQQNYADYLGLIDYQRTVGDLGGYSPTMNSGAGYGSGNTIVVNTGIGDPNAIAEAIDQVLQEAYQRGTLSGGLYAV